MTSGPSGHDSGAGTIFKVKNLRPFEIWTLQFVPDSLQLRLYDI